MSIRLLARDLYQAKKKLAEMEDRFNRACETEKQALLPEKNRLVREARQLQSAMEGMLDRKPGT